MAQRSSLQTKAYLGPSSHRMTHLKVVHLNDLLVEIWSSSDAKEVENEVEVAV